ncbi:hypothetical protein BDZ89DRAFT_1062010 [Hymenopellis radicata]|nr:hypothetical protein BDZ89DRAFT_1062010 [Hymenopellis radicata]
MKVEWSFFCRPGSVESWLNPGGETRLAAHGLSASPDGKSQGGHMCICLRILGQRLAYFLLYLGLM